MEEFDMQVAFAKFALIDPSGQVHLNIL